MVESEQVQVTLQSGVTIDVNAWEGSDAAQPLVIVGPGSKPSDWDEFVSFLASSHAPVLANVSSAIELMMFIWEIGEPALVLAQGADAARWSSQLVSSSPASASAIVVCDGEFDETALGSMHEISTLILRGRQGVALTHEAAVRMHASLRHSTLTEPENCGDFPAKDNPDAAAAAVNWFINGASEVEASEPVDPKG